jgi:sensor histidine kinase regulating citrate/malate metabolism
MMQGWSITRRLLLVHCVVIALLTVLVGTSAYVDSRDRGYRETADRMLSVAIAIADNPLVVIAAQSSNPTAALQGYTRTVSERADIDVISVMSPAGVRWTHSNQARIGESHPGQVAGAAAGRSLTEVSPGVRGPRVRALVPIHDSDDAVVGLVAAEVETSTLQTVLDARLPAILALALALLLAVSVAIGHVGRHLRRVTLGWGPEELARQFQHSDSVLHAATEGLVLVNRRRLLVLCNDSAADLLGIPPRHGARAGSSAPHLTDLTLPAGLAELLSSGRTVRNELHSVNGRVLLVSQEPALPTTGRTRSRSNPVGTVMILRDALSGVGSIDDPVVGALVAAKIRGASERGVRLTVTASDSLAGTGLPVQRLVARIGTLLDTAIDAAADAAVIGAASTDTAAANSAPSSTPGTAFSAWVTVAMRIDPALPALVLEVTGSAVPGSRADPDAAQQARAVTIPLPPPEPAPKPTTPPTSHPLSEDEPATPTQSPAEPTAGSTRRGH